MSYSDLIAQNQRHAILEILREANGYSVNTHIIQRLLADLGLAASHSTVSGVVTWLCEQGLITLEATTPVVVKLTHTGLDVANGHASHPDIARPLL